MSYSVFKYIDKKSVITTHANSGFITLVVVDGTIVFEADEIEESHDLITKAKYKGKSKIESAIRKKIKFDTSTEAGFFISEMLVQSMTNAVISYNSSKIKDWNSSARILLDILDRARDFDLIKSFTHKEEKDIGSILKIIKEQKRKVNNN